MKANRLSSRLRAARAAAAVGTAVGLILALGTPAAAHDKGVLKLASKVLTAGDSLPVLGAKFSRNDELTIVLIGVAGRRELGTTPTDSAGKFIRKFLVPTNTKPGQYRLVAEAIDGDKVATIDVVVQAHEPAAPTGAMPAGAVHEGMSMEAHPSGATLQLTRARNSVEMWIVGLLIIACIATGAILLRGRHAVRVEDPS